tara:strand:- start:274 stop:816 length:543 start_codon:yes stop_codon:yes gene_type:complete
MTVTATNLIQGPATIYAGAFGATEPADIDTAPGVGWTDLGGTKEGVTLNIEQTFADLTVDQIIDVVGRKRTGRSINVATSLAEPTLENLARAMNNTAPTSDVVELDNDESAFSPDYGAVLLDGLAPGGLRRRIILRKTLQTGNIAMAYTKDGQTVIPVTFALHWVSASIKALKIEDETEA